MLLRAFATMFVAGSLAGQPTPGSIVVTHSALIYGPSVADSAGDIYATVEGGATPGGFLGTGSSTAVATPGAAQTQGGGGLCPAPPFGGPVPCTDAFVAKTDPSGNIVWATFLGGPTSDYASAIAIDSSGNVYVAGETGGSFPTTAGAAIASSTTSQTFAAKLSADGSKFLYVTYLPSAMATVNAISVDAEGNAYIVGDTAGSTQAPERVYAVKLSADGSTFAYSATLGGSSGDSGTSVTGDATGHAFVTGWTRSKDFPVTAGVVQPQFAGAQSAFVTELDAAGNIVASTLLGGSGLDAGGQILLDSNRNVYVVGTTTSPDFPITSGAFETAPAVQAWQDSLSESFAVKLLPDLSGAVYATYFPSSGGGMIALGSQGDLYVGGGYAPPGLPLTASAPLRCPSGGYLAHLNASGTLVDGTYVSPSGGGMSGGLFALTPQSNGSLLEVSFDATEITWEARAGSRRRASA